MEKLHAQSIPIKKIDLHIHTTFSDGICTAEEAVKTAEVKGLIVVAVTDHYSEFQRLPRRMSHGQHSKYLQTLEGLNVHKGVEVEILQNGTVSLSKKNAEFFDIIIGGLHSINDRVFWNDPRPIWKPRGFVEDVRVALIKAMESNILDVIAHVTWLPEAIRGETPNLISNTWIASIVHAASDCGVAVELNSAWKVPDERLVSECIRNGIRLSIGSDAHLPSMIGKVGFAVNMLKRLRVPRELIFLPKERALSL